MQLFEAGINALLFSALLVWALVGPTGTEGRALPAYLVGYGVWRFASDFWRDVSARPRRAGLSEAQWMAMIVVALSAAVLLGLAAWPVR